MKVHAVACAILIGITSAPAVAGPTNWSRAALFGDVVVRPPRGIPHARPIGRSAAMMPFPRARPGAAPPLASAAAKADSPPATGAPAAPDARPADNDAKAPQSFPPAVGFE